MTKILFVVFATAGFAAFARADIAPMNETPQQYESRVAARQAAREARAKDKRDREETESKLEVERLKAQEAELEEAERERARRAAENKRARMLELGLGAAVLGVVAAAGVYKAKR